MAQRFALHLLTTATIVAAFYFFTAFVAWDWNPENWDMLARFCAAVCSLVFSGVAAAGREQV
jgi:hypothetical protein